MQIASDFGEIIADFVRQAFPQFDSRLEDQAEALRETRCTNPLIGRWIDTNNVEYLLSAFAMKDQDFAEEFPGMSYVGTFERQRVLATLEAHLESCRHCALKRGFDLEFEARLKLVFRQNSHLLLELLEEDGVPGKNDRQGNALKRLFS